MKKRHTDSLSLSLCESRKICQLIPIHLGCPLFYATAAAATESFCCFDNLLSAKVGRLKLELKFIQSCLREVESLGVTVLTEDLRSFDMKNISEVMRRNLRNLFMENYFFYLQIEFL